MKKSVLIALTLLLTLPICVGATPPASSVSSASSEVYNIADHIGVTHTGGKYNFTDKPFIVEGAELAHEMGFKTIKFFLRKDMQAIFPYNSEWKTKKSDSWVDILEHKYFDEVFKLDFETIVFNITDHENKLGTQNPNFDKCYEELNELTTYLLERFRDRNITFIIKNWEGDWVLRTAYKNKKQWLAIPANVVALRTKNFIDWINTRQRAVSDARDAFKGESKCRVFLAVEANKVMDSMEGVVGVANSVLPNTKVDMVSWSSYDGVTSPERLRKGLRYLKDQHNNTGAFSTDNSVFIGEIGIPEMLAKFDILKRWKACLDVCADERIPYIIHWELFCNESSSDDKKFYPQKSEEQLRGLWIMRPDGELGIAGEYICNLLKERKNDEK